MYRYHTPLTNISSVSCPPDMTLRDVMRTFNEARYAFLVVLDDHGRLLGTITDGDVRRSMLNGLSLDAPAQDCMHTPPLFGHVNDRWDDLEKPQSIHFLPMLDDDGVVRFILVPSVNQSPIRSALIMAGGLGSRLGEMTRNTPKPLLPVSGKPILEHILLQLENIQVENIYISVHYLSDHIEAFIKARNNQAKIVILHEVEMLGTAGALSRLPETLDHPLLVMNGDVITDVNFSALAHFHNEQNANATVGVSDYQVNVPFGVVVPGENGHFAGINEKPVLNFPIIAGIYLITPSLISLTPRDERIDMPDLLNRALDKGLKIATFPIHEYWIDVGRIEDLHRAKKSYV